MLKKRDAQGLSITMIIVAVLGLIVLVVMIVIFTKESGKNIDILESCGARGGICENPGSCIGGTQIPEICQKNTGPGVQKICCVRI